MPGIQTHKEHSLMDSEVMDVLRELGCFSATVENPIDETADCAVDGDDLDSIDDQWIDLGGEG
jgi:hypothetical protein